MVGQLNYRKIKSLNIHHICLGKEKFVNHNASENYLHSPYRFSLYSGIRCIECIIGITGNIFTLIILKKFKSRTKGHILIVYLAIFDTLLSSVFQLAVYMNATETIIEKGTK